MNEWPQRTTSVQQWTPIDVKAILAYPSYGWHVVPCYGLVDGDCECQCGVNCKSPGKHPRVGMEWQNKAITDEDELVAFWERFPHSNCGILLGPKSGVIDVEIDGPEGEEIARRCGLFDGIVTPTFVSARGEHRLFVWEGRFQQIGKAKVTVGGLDFLLGAGENASQSVIPPSMHAGGQQRQWLPGLSPYECDPVRLPDAAWELIRPTNDESSAVLSLSDRKGIVGGVGEGHRHESAKSYIGSRIADVRNVRSDDAIDRVWIDVLELNERNIPPLPEEELKELFEWTVNKERERRTGKDSVEEVAINPTVSIRPAQARTTPSGKLVIPLTVLVDGQPVDEVELTSSRSGRQQAEKAIVLHTQEVANDDIGKALGQLIVESRKRIQAANESGVGDTIRDIVFKWVPERFKLAYKTERGAWSESRRCEISRNEFVSFTPVELIELCGESIDAPRNEHGLVRESQLLKQIESALKVLWATSVDKLPVQESDAELDDRSSAARRFRQKTVETWTKLTTHERVLTKEDGKEIEVAARASLASRVQTMQKEEGRLAANKWQRVQRGFDAWVRPYVTNDGELIILLAQRYTLAGQLGIKVPHTGGQREFRRIGLKYGVFTDATNGADGITVRDRLSDGTRLAILDVNLAKEILADTPEIEHEYDFTDVAKAD